MWIGLLWIVGCYGLGVILLHWFYETRKLKNNKAVRILFVTKNNQMHIEWYIRSLFFFSWLRGRNITAKILDEGSTDETLKIIERLSHKHSLELEVSATLVPADEFMQADHQEEWIVVRLSNQDEVLKTLMFH